MNFDRSLIFSYLEEDNIQRAYFRVRPLLTLDGDIQQEAAQLWPNEGCLRIVPDRNEQHTFKTRMRTLGAYCVVDLRNQPTEAGKIRTNKNFRPEKGEVNQYILYSDTVHALPENTFYQLMEGAPADFVALAEGSVTPLFYIRENDTLYGPVSKAAPAQPGTAKEAAGMLFELLCPDGVTRHMLCMEDASAVSVAPAEKATPEGSAAPLPKEVKPEEKPMKEPEKQPEAPKSEKVEEAAEAKPAQDVLPATNLKTDASEKAEDPLPIGESLKILDEHVNHEETLKKLDKPVSSGANLLHQQSSKSFQAEMPSRKKEELSGTPLVRTPLRVSVQQSKNRTQEIVNSQWSVGKYEPPTQNLPAGASLRAVSNPVETACTALREAWNVSSAHDQLTDFMMSLAGIRGQLETKLCNGSTVTVMQRVLRERLQDLEAERLSALCELDKAKHNVDAYKQELISGLSAKISKETDKLEHARNSAQTQLTSLKSEINALTLQRDALQTKVAELQSDLLPEAAAKLLADMQMLAPSIGTPLRMSPVSGVQTEPETLIQIVQNVCKDSGVEISRNHAIAMLVLLAVSPRIGLASPTPAPVGTLLKNIAAALGWQESYAHQIAAEQRPVTGMRPVDSTPAVLTTSLPNFAPINGVTKLLLNRNVAGLIRNAAYDVGQWPILQVPALPFVPELDATRDQPVSAASIAAFAAKQVASDVELDAVLTPVLKAAVPLAGAARKELYRFVAVCAGLMEGGLPVAVDWGILLWIVPALERGSKAHQAVKALLDEYPLSLSAL